MSEGKWEKELGTAELYKDLLGTEWIVQGLHTYIAGIDPEIGITWVLYEDCMKGRFAGRKAGEHIACFKPKTYDYPRGFMENVSEMREAIKKGDNIHTWEKRKGFSAGEGPVCPFE